MTAYDIVNSRSGVLKLQLTCHAYYTINDKHQALWPSLLPTLVEEVVEYFLIRSGVLVLNHH